MGLKPQHNDSLFPVLKGSELQVCDSDGAGFQQLCVVVKKASLNMSRRRIEEEELEEGDPG